LLGSHIVGVFSKNGESLLSNISGIGIFEKLDFSMHGTCEKAFLVARRKAINLFSQSLRGLCFV
jgi:hypothetical protein